MFTAIFFDKSNEKVFRLISDNPLEVKLEKPHIKVGNFDEKEVKALFGTPIIVEVLGYGSNDIAEVLACRIQSPRKDMQKLLDKVNKPIIALSTKNGVENFNINKMKFTKLNMPYTCKGFFGGYDEKNRKFLFDGEKIW